MDSTWLTPADKTMLNSCFLLQGLSTEVVERTLVDPRCRGLSYTKDQVIYDPERFQRALGLILSGKVEAAQHTADRELILRLLEPGNVFGAAALFAESPNYPSRLTALTKTRVLFFDETLLRDLMTEAPVLAENYIRFLTGRVHFLNRRIQSLIAGNTEALLANFLQGGTEDRETIHLDTSLSGLARRLGISRASLYRAFDTLEHRGLIKKSGKTITILNRDGLQSL